MNEVSTGNVVYELDITENGFEFATTISDALSTADEELDRANIRISENEESLKKLTPECDKLDYTLAATCGAICGVIDVFLVGKPGESPVGNITDEWFGNRTKDFAKLCGWDSKENDSLSDAIRHLEKKFKIPYDQRGAGDVASWIFDLTPSNHHFKSLGHNPTICGLFFSVLDQFTNTSHFISDGQLISLQDADGRFVLRGNDVPSKLFCGFMNWFGHIISDISGSSSSSKRGMGIPSPLWTWMNDIIAVKSKIGIPVTEFDKSFNDIALEIYKQGYDSRFQTAQAIPVFVNELLVRTVYCVRRLIRYFANSERNERSFKAVWEACEPFANATVKRMLTVAHGTFCLIDVGDATIRAFAAGGGYFNPAEFMMRLNLPGIGRFTISLYGEGNRAIERYNVSRELRLAEREKTVIYDYIEGLKYLSETYNDSELLTFVNDFEGSNLYKDAFEKTVKLGEMRSVPQDEILKSKSDIDNYFRGGKA